MIIHHVWSDSLKTGAHKPEVIVLTKITLKTAMDTYISETRSHLGSVQVFFDQRKSGCLISAKHILNSADNPKM